MNSPEMELPCLALHEEGVTLSVKASPNAYRTEAQGLWQKNLRVRIQAPPVEGKANEALIKWAGRAFGIRPSQVEMIRSAKSKEKTLLLRKLELRDARRILSSLLEPPPED